MIDVQEIALLHAATVRAWHAGPVANPFDGFLQLVCQQHAFNFLLWHEEDIARSPEVSDARIAAVKRSIDRYNQQRNDGIEQLDDRLIAMLRERGVSPLDGARRNTETPGSAIDRLSVLSLRIFHMQEQAERTDASPEHLAKSRDRVAILHTQHADLCAALQELVNDISAGRKLLRVYRQLKMYNDPTLNPYLYRTGQAA